MIKHTQSPWAVNPVTAQVDAFDGVDKMPVPICKLLWPTGLRSEAETEANARLIAAAPDLLEALEAAADELDRLTAVLDAQDCESVDTVVDKARAALGAAIGGER